MHEVHAGVCGPHMNGYVLAKKILRAGYYWITMEKDCFSFVRKYHQCQKRKVNIACVQETRWAGSKERNADGYKLWYSGVVRSKNEVGILVDRDLRGSVVEVRRVNNRLMFIKLVIGECTLNVVSAYVPQTGLDEEVKRRFWEGLDEIVRSIPLTKRLFIGGDFSGHIGAAAGSYGEVHGDFGLGDSNRGGTSLLDFAKAFELVIANSTFPKREEYLVTF
uniref:Craniofacial development protein 2-like n=1 Tax=Nicotiana sylvestris TaxID=4096 RepID=A0A1U7WPB9_NICSY|nr:PREDICTED: craniofacial development protein 2-like [Nicotiana sylvestris]